MNKPKSEQPSAEPVVLSVSVISDGKFFSAGSETPFTEETLPAHLREYIASGDEDFYHPRERDIYSAHLRRQARQVLGNALWQDEAEAAAEAAQRLPEDVQQALEDAHNFRIARLKAQMEVDRGLSDAVYEMASKEVEVKTSQYFVKRGAVYTAVEKVAPKPAELVFTKDVGGDWRAVGYVDSEGQLPDQEIRL